MAEEFQRKVQQMYDGGCASFGLALGSELGLFQAMADLNRPFTAQELAQAAECKERYIREWLNAMACVGIADYDADKQQFYITSEKLPCLTKLTCAPVGVLAVIGQKHNLLKECIKLNGPPGINQVDSPDSAKWLADFRATHFDDVLEEMVLKDIPNMRDRLESGITVVDLGCGSGLMALMIAERFPKSKVWGLDIDDRLLKLATDLAKDKNLKNVTFSWADAEKLSEEWSETFDYIFTYDVIHDLPFPRIALEEIRKCLKDGGVFSLFEPNFHSSLENNIQNHPGADPYILSLYWCLTHSLTTPNSEGLGRCMGKEKHAEYIKLAGFKDFKLILREMNHFMCYK